MNEKLAEETGMHIGDGSMNFYAGKGLYSLRGHKSDDRDYYEGFVRTLFKETYAAEVRLREWSDVFGFQLCSSDLVKFKHERLGLPLGPKGEIKIPEKIAKNKKFAKACLRGLFDTDGNIYFEMKYGRPYPRITIYTTSKTLANQIEIIVEKLGFTSFSRWTTRLNEKWKPVHKICIRGRKNFKLWYEVVGTSNPKNRKKFERFFSSSEAKLLIR